MHRLVLAIMVVILAACASTATKQFASEPTPLLGVKCDSTVSSFLFGRPQSSASCAEKTPVPKCEVVPTTRWYNSVLESARVPGEGPALGLRGWC
jgi:hypothetical protein